MMITGGPWSVNRNGNTFGSSTARRRWTRHFTKIYYHACLQKGMILPSSTEHFKKQHRELIEACFMSSDFESLQFDCTGAVLFDSKIAKRKLPVKTAQIWAGKLYRLISC